MKEKTLTEPELSQIIDRFMGEELLKDERIGRDFERLTLTIRLQRYVLVQLLSLFYKRDETNLYVAEPVRTATIDEMKSMLGMEDL